MKRISILFREEKVAEDILFLKQTEIGKVRRGRVTPDLEAGGSDDDKYAGCVSFSFPWFVCFSSFLGDEG
jgi:hypothetical protein